MLLHVRFEVFTPVTVKNAIFWDVSCVALVRTDDSEEGIASIIRMARIGELGATLAVTGNRSTLRRSTMYSHMKTSQFVYECCDVRTLRLCL
jgi:demethoxyubiquinone hydroxylase (CLK1/Coq7/Cat5 family)